jgi:hypothetical protein
MSAAEPATPGPDHALMAAVTPIVRTAARPPRREQRRESPRVPQQPTSGSGLSPHEKLAATVENLFAKHGKSLTDEDTAEDFLITLQAVRIMLRGAREQCLVGEDAFTDLDVMLEGMMAAPGLLV